MEMFEDSAEVDAMCVRLATFRLTPLERSHLIELHESLLAMVGANDVDAYDAFNSTNASTVRLTTRLWPSRRRMSARCSAPSVAPNCGRAIASASPAMSTTPSCRQSRIGTAIRPRAEADPYVECRPALRRYIDDCVSGPSMGLSRTISDNRGDKPLLMQTKVRAKGRLPQAWRRCSHDTLLAVSGRHE